MAQAGYKFGKWFGANFVFLLVVVGAFAIVWTFDGALSAPPPTPRHLQPQVSQSEATRPVESAYALLKTRCTAEMEDRRVKAEALMKKRDYQAAYETLDECKMFTGDPRVLKVYEAATIAVTKETERANAKAERLAKIERKKAGVHIGMSQNEVVDSMWGRPRKINRTTRASGTHEQWVYDGGYLYFEDGILTAIQN